MCRVLELVPQVEQVIRRLDRWCYEHVVGFPGIDSRSYAGVLAYYLGHGCCPCHGPRCAVEHDVAAQEQSCLSLTSFLYRAVIGPGGLLVNSIVQGMAYPELQKEVQVQKALVEWKQCHSCGREYEGGKCPFCHSPYSPADTPLMGRDWLVIPGVYEEVRRWGCGPRECRHYSPQELCCEARNVEYGPDLETAKVRYHVQHHPGGQHDRCLLQRCRETGSCRHAERGTTLWVRANRFSQSGPTAPARAGLADAIDKGMARALEAWDEETRRRLVLRFGDNRLEMAKFLLQEGSSLITPPQREQLRRFLQQVLAEQGIDGEDA
jgi:hypothetical protein